MRDNGLVLTKVSADASGQFAILPSPLSVGGHHLQLAARTTDAADVLSEAVSVDVPAAAAKTSVQTPSEPAVLTPSPNQTSRAPMTEAVKPSETPQTDTGVNGVRSAKVVRGDNLWRISQHYLGDGMRYLQIYSANATQVRSPHLIYPGEVLVIPNAAAPKQ